jgi:chromate reductase, NAD(P)H dehydrogenase (quinone)
MTRMPVLAFSGSLRSGSLNSALLIVAERAAPEAQFVGAELVADLPLFNPDLDAAASGAPASVRRFRELARAAEAVVIASPEYVYAPSGVTKNALDWLSGCGALDGKPTLLMSASLGQTGGIRGLVALFPTLQLLGAVLIDPVSISRAQDRLDALGNVFDPSVYQRIEFAMDDLQAATALSRTTTPSPRS